MRIEIWSDVVCPWCYIGKRRLERALEEMTSTRRDGSSLASSGQAKSIDETVEIVWRSYQLDPSAPAVPTETVAESLGRKYGGGPEAGRAMIDRVEAVAAEEGLIFRHHQSLRANTTDAHRLLHLARVQGLQGELKEALLAAYFTHTENVADHDTLRKIAAGVGLDAQRVDEVLGSAEFSDEMWADIAQAQAYGATGVPFFVVDGKYGVSGAQPTEVFAQVIERAWRESHPSLEVIGGDDACGPDGCAI
jgi:predicted DsbA family dithiol-disulfide isomerase